MFPLKNLVRKDLIHHTTGLRDPMKWFDIRKYEKGKFTEIEHICMKTYSCKIIIWIHPH